MIRLLFGLLAVISFFISNAEGKSKVGFPLIQNYTKSTYKAANQNWSITQDEDRVMYYGNADGVLSFDGKYWQLYQMPNKIIVRAVAADGKGKVYAGGFGEMGYWSYNAKGKFVYTSLTHLIPKANKLTSEVWKIYPEKDGALFQSFDAIYRYQAGRITIVKGPQAFLFLLKAGDKYFAEVLAKGLYEVKGNNMVFVPGSEALVKTHILSVLPYERGKYIIGTAKDGLFLYDGNSIIPWENEANEILKAFQLNNGAVLLGQYMAYGTILNGVIILDKQGNIVQHLNKSKGLQNNTVLSLYSDTEQNLWLGLDNGISRIEINSPLYFYFDKTGQFGTVYSSIVHDNKIYLGTNQGLFYSEWQSTTGQSYQNYNFQMIEGSQGQVWDLSLKDGELLCGHNEGTFKITGTSIQKISSFSGWTIKKLTTQPDLLIQGTYTGLAIYKKDEQGKWGFSHQVTGFSEPARYVEQDHDGNIWVSHAYRGLYKLTLSEDLKTVKRKQYYDQKSGLPSDYHVNVFKLNNRILFSSEAGFYIYDEISNRFKRYQELNSKLGGFAFSNQIIFAGNRRYWFVNHGKVALVDFTDPSKLEVCVSPFRMLNNRMVQDYENISKISNSVFLISIDDGFVVYNSEVTSYKKRTVPPVLIRKVQTFADTLATLAETGSRVIEIPYDQRSIRISYALPFYGQINPTYKTQLKGYDESWSGWSEVSQKDLIGLSPGEYTFLVMARIDNGSASPVTSFTFIILPPWYLTYWAMLGYVALAIMLLLFFRFLYQKKLERDQQKIEEKLQREKEEALRQEAIAHEQNIIRLKNEQLQAELAAKSRELANSALNIVSKTELLQSIKEELAQLKDAAGKKLPSDQLKKVQKVLDDGMSNEQDWSLFENSFNEAHENFFKKLKSSYPDLTPNDVKLCAFLRMNMNSKEIASLLNITLRGVEIRRYRLRKKLNLEHDQNLVEFLINV